MPESGFHHPQFGYERFDRPRHMNWLLFLLENIMNVFFILAVEV